MRYPPLVAAVGFAVVACVPAGAGEVKTHIDGLLLQLDLHKRADSCGGTNTLCRNLRRKAARAGCFPPIVTWSSVGEEPIVVRALITVSSSGRVQAVEIIQPSTYKALNEAVVESMANCRLPKVQREGVPVGSQFLMEWSMRPDETMLRFPRSKG